MASIEELKSKYTELCSLPADATAGQKRARGYAFERLLADLLAADNLEPRTSYKTIGEQIDGSFFLDGAVFLIEAKWHADPMEASQLYQFKGKVDGKLSGTIGVFLSMSGYSKDAVNALGLGKALNLVLFDKQDMDAMIEKDLGFREVLKRKLRMAAEEGAVYFPTVVDVVTVEKQTHLDVDALSFDQTTGKFLAASEESQFTQDLIVVCEGPSDRELIARLVRRILERTGSKKSVRIVVAMGKVTVPRVVNAMFEGGMPEGRLIVVVDGDNDIVKTSDLLEKEIRFAGWISVIPNPEIESWLGVDRQHTKMGSGKIRVAYLLQAAETVDLDALKRADSQFARFYEAVAR